mmetsp:Transcript_22661/g.57684  ORF Transcript_22661/g.57684 Transcript_22661/m.57684 type:complete len:242 (+) Transcript_22661:1235-1960(+)
MTGSSTARLSACERSLPIAAQFSTPIKRTESCSSVDSAEKSGSSSVLSAGCSPASNIAEASLARWAEAARRTMGVSSRHSCAKSARISARVASGSASYATATRAQAEMREVNQSPWARRLVSGSTCSSRCSRLSWRATFRSDSTALSRTRVSSTVESSSSGWSRVAACGGPPTYSTKLPSSSASAMSTSSSSSIDSLRNGMSSLRVRSTPSATAMVESLRMEFKRSFMSSFLSSSIRIATG